MSFNNTKILIIQTAFIGDVILATSLVEYIKNHFSETEIHFLLRKGNESILANNNKISKVHIWNKQKKISSLISTIVKIREEKFDTVINIQRFFSSGLITLLSGAQNKVGFNKNPLSFFFTYSLEHKIPHKIENEYLHEVQRNITLLQNLITDYQIPDKLDLKPKLYFSEKEKIKIDSITSNLRPYIVIAPASVWYTKQWHIEKWKLLVSECMNTYDIVMIGGPPDRNYLNQITDLYPSVINLVGKLSLTESALIMKDAKRVFVNDSAPLHLASSVNAKTTAIFCSTSPDFGYTPIADDSKIISEYGNLECLPCGLHGHKKCPKNHFKCSGNIEIKAVIDTI